MGDKNYLPQKCILLKKNKKSMTQIKLAKTLELPRVMNFSGYEGIRVSFSKLASLVAAMGVLGLGNPMNASLGESLIFGLGLGEGIGP